MEIEQCKSFDLVLHNRLTSETFTDPYSKCTHLSRWSLQAFKIVRGFRCLEGLLGMVPSSATYGSCYLELLWRRDSKLLEVTWSYFGEGTPSYLKLLEVTLAKGLQVTWSYLKLLWRSDSKLLEVTLAKGLQVTWSNFGETTPGYWVLISWNWLLATYKLASSDLLQNVWRPFACSPLFAYQKSQNRLFSSYVRDWKGLVPMKALRSRHK